MNKFFFQASRQSNWRDRHAALLLLKRQPEAQPAPYHCVAEPLHQCISPLRLARQGATSQTGESCWHEIAAGIGDFPSTCCCMLKSPLLLAFSLKVHVKNRPIPEIVQKEPHFGNYFVKGPHRGKFASLKSIKGDSSSTFQQLSNKKTSKRTLK